MENKRARERDKDQLLGTKSPRPKEKLVKEYSPKNKKANRSVGRDERKFVESLAIRAE